MVKCYIRDIIKNLTNKSLVKTLANDIFVFVSTLKEIKLSRVSVIGIMLLFVGLTNVYAAQRYAVASGNWNTAIWASTSGGAAGSAAVPTSSDDVFINDNRNVIVNVAANCSSLTISNGGNVTSVTISNTNSLAITNGITIGIGSGSGDNKYIDVAAGSLSCASITMNDPGNNNRDSYIRITTGTATVSGNITMNGSNGRNQIVFAGAGVLNVGGTVSGGTISSASGGYIALTSGTVNYNGSGQTVGSYNYYNLTLSGSGTKTLGGNTTVSQILSMEGTASLSLGGFTLTYGSAATIQYKGTSSRTTGVEFPNGFAGSGGLIVDQGAGNTVTLNANKTALTNINIKSGTLDLSTFTANRTSAGGTLTVAGTLMLGGTTGGQTGSNFPTNFSTVILTGGTVNYDNATGAQTVYSTPTYNNLTLGNTSGTQTAGGALTVNGTLTTTSGGTLNMATNQLLGTLTTISNGGAIRTQNTSATPIPTGKTWGGTVNYDAVSGGQIVVVGTYNNLTVGNSSGTQTAGGALTINGTLTTTSGGNLNMVTNQLLGTLATIANAGTIQTQNTSTTPVPAGKTWGGTVIFDGTTSIQTIPVATFMNLSLNNSSGASLSGAVVVNGVLTLTNGILRSSGSVYSLTVTNSSPTAVSGGSSTSYIWSDVAFIRYLAPSLTNSSTYEFPVGNSIGGYYPFTLSNLTTGTGTITAQVQCYYGNSGGTLDATLLSKSTAEFWRLYSTGNLTSASVSIQRPTAISPFNTIGTSKSQGGTYTSLRGTAGVNSVTNSNVLSVTGSPVYNYFVFAKESPSITTSVSSLTGFAYGENVGPSAIQSFTVAGYSLVDNIKLSMYHGNFELSTTGGASFAGSSVIYLPVLNGNVAPTLVYVRMKAGLSQKALYTDSIVVSSELESSTLTKIVSCSGSVTSAPAVVATPATRTGFVYTYNSSSTLPQSFAVSGTNLVGNVIVTPPTDYEISTGSTYQTTPVTLTPTGGTLNSTTINVRMRLGLGIGSHIQNVVVSSTGATSQNVLCSGTVNPAPTIYNDKSLLAGFVYSGAGPSGVQTFQVSGTNLTAPIVLTPQANYEISLSSGSGYVSTTTTTKFLSISPSGGTVNPTTIYVRLKSGLATGNYNLVSIVMTSSGAITKSVTCSGSVVSTATLTSSKTTLTAFGYMFGTGPSSEQSFSVSGAALGIYNLTVTPSANYEISTGSGASFVASSTITFTPSAGKVDPKTIYVRLKAGLGTAGQTQTFGPEDIVVAAAGSGAGSINVSCSGKVFASPLISASATGTPACPNSTISLSSTGADIQTRYWQGPNNFYSTDQNPVLATNNSTPVMTGTYTVTGNVLVGGNLITNGDFESGNTSFGSGYGYVTPAANALYNEGLYTIVANPQSVHDNFTTNGDHTDSPGTLQMVANGSPTAGVVVWSQSVPVIPGATYQFTYWEQTVCMPSPSQLQLYVNGVAAGPVYTASSTVPQWTQFLYNASAGSNTVLNLELVNQNTIAGGNDFALDDIVFQQILTATASVNVLVNDNLPPSVSITATATSVAQGATVSFTATPTNGGDTPNYQWKVNGNNVGTNSSVFSYIPSDKDTVTCTMTSSLTCSGSATSNSIPMTVAQPVNYWRGTNGSNWGDASNWTAGYVPGPGENVIYASTTNSYKSDAINDLILDQNRTIGSLINATSKRLVIPAGKGLTVNNTVTTDNNPDRIYIHCDSLNANGSLIYHNASTSPVYATVEMYSKASWNLSNTVNNKYYWQYFGIPVQSVTAEPTFSGSFVRRWVETGTDITNHWVQLNNTDVLQPFYGYELCQAKPKVFYFKGALVNSDFNSGQLAYTYFGAGNPQNALFPGQHVFANPYTSAIDIRQLAFGSQTEASVFMYNTGTYSNWTTGGQTTAGTNPGKYVTASKNLAGAGGIPRQVPSMGTMLVKALSNSTQATFGIAYNTVAMVNTDLQRVSAGDKTTADKIYTKIDVSSSTGGDRMWIFSEPGCSRNFENGWDGVKMLGSSLSPELFALEPDGNYQIDVLDDMNNTDLAFQAGIDVEYTLTFTHENTSRYYPGIYLLDKVENKIVDITASGSQYKFIAQSTPKPVDRFRLVTRYYYKEDVDKTSEVKVFSSKGMIFVHNFSAHNGNAMVFDVSGHFVKKVSFSSNGLTVLNGGLAPGAYVVKCLTESEDVTTRVIVR